MKNLQTLIKLRQRELDVLRRNIGTLQDELDKLIAKEQRLQAQLMHEKQLAAEQPEMAHFFGNFVQGNEQQQEEVRMLQQAVNVEIEKLREKLTEAFGELKRLEITQEKILADLAEAKKYKEQLELDEMGLQQFVRKPDDKMTEESDG